jgi:hypothetical protein
LVLGLGAPKRLRVTGRVSMMPRLGLVRVRVRVRVVCGCGCGCG